MTTLRKPADSAEWLDIAAKLADLPGGQRNEGFALRKSEELLNEFVDEANNADKHKSSTARVEAWMTLLRDASDAPELAEFFAYRPSDVIRVLGPKLFEQWRWSTLVEIYEAGYQLAIRNAGDRGPAGGVPFAWQLGAAHLARTRWVLLCLPFAGIRPEDHGLRRVDDDLGRLVALAQQARSDWLAVLAAIDDYPLLAGRIGDVEDEVWQLVSVQVTQINLWPDPSAKAKSAKAESAEDRADPLGRETDRFAVTRLLLPRFAWRRSTAICFRSMNALPLTLNAVAAAAVVSAMVLPVIGYCLHLTWGYTAAAATAATAYVLIAWATGADRRAAWPWLLRQPASAAVGLLAVAAFGPSWWYTGGARGDTARALVAAAGLAGAALVYLCIEAAGHGVRGRRLAGRSLLVSGFGLVHGVLVGLIGLRFLLPIFAASPPGGPALSCWYTPGACHGQALPVLVLLAIAAAWSLAAGVFLQIIWDDQPVTAPLAHVSWHRGG
jgi:hypothetical protein